MIEKMATYMVCKTWVKSSFYTFIRWDLFCNINVLYRKNSYTIVCVSWEPLLGLYYEPALRNSISFVMLVMARRNCNWGCSWLLCAAKFRRAELNRCGDHFASASAVQGWAACGFARARDRDRAGSSASPPSLRLSSALALPCMPVSASGLRLCLALGLGFFHAMNWSRVHEWLMKWLIVVFFTISNLVVDRLPFVPPA